MEHRTGQSLRRLRIEPLDTVTRLTEYERGTTSLGEAQAAAYLDGRFRLAGLRVSADTFQVGRATGVDGLILALPAIVSMVMYYRLPYPSLFLAIWGLAISIVLLRRPGMVLVAQRRQSQNVVATRAANVNGRPRRRVVLLAALDAPPVLPALVRLLCDDLRLQIGRVVAYALLTLFSILAMIGPFEVRLAWWYAQFLPTAYLCLLAGLEFWLARAPTSPGAANYAGALAALLASAEELVNLERTELWAVALGASTSGTGLADFLRRYPFDRDMTLFVGLEGIGVGNLCYVTREGLFHQHAAHPHLLQMAIAADTADPLINAEPRPYRRILTNIGHLRRSGRTGLSIVCLGANGETPNRATLADQPETLDPQLIERTTRLLVGLVRRIDSYKP